MTRYDDEIRLLREAGCKCEMPLRGHYPKSGPRVRHCTKCGVVAKEPSSIKDACQVCHGESGGEPGNENIENGVIMCDYCSSKTWDQRVK